MADDAELIIDLADMVEDMKHGYDDPSMNKRIDRLERVVEQMFLVLYHRND